MGLTVLQQVHMIIVTHASISEGKVFIKQLIKVIVSSHKQLSHNSIPYYQSFISGPYYQFIITSQTNNGNPITSRPTF